MDIETLEQAKTIHRKWQAYMESMQHLHEASNRRCANNLYISTGDGWGFQGIYIPDDAVPEILSIVRKSLEKNIEELERRFKGL